jgi:hypothetical protein
LFLHADTFLPSANRACEAKKDLLRAPLLAVSIATGPLALSEYGDQLPRQLGGINPFVGVSYRRADTGASTNSRVTFAIICGSGLRTMGARASHSPQHASARLLR